MTSDGLESAEAIGAVDEVLASAGLTHGRRSTRAGTWKNGERAPKATRQASTARHPAGSQIESVPGLERVPAWAVYSWLHAGFSTREGGRSAAYDPEGVARDQNLGWTTEEEMSLVAAARDRFLKALGGSGNESLMAARQFHSGLIREVEGDPSALRTSESKPVLRGDGLITSQAGLMLGVLTADCVPVLVADTRRRVVAAFHAGWRGTLARIVERGIGTMRLQHGSRPEDLTAAIGPAIGPCCFAVGEEVRFEFESQFSYAPELFSEVYDSDPVRDKYPLLFLTARAPGHSNLGPQIHLDLQQANRRQLLAAGLRPEAVYTQAECTACTRLEDGRRKYFSHRGEHGFTGRMLSVIGTAAG